jgi:hypothetical protein
LDIDEERSSRTHNCGIWVIDMKTEKGKGAPGLGKGVGLVGTEEKESCDLWSYGLVHGINSILSQDVLTILS